MEGEPLTLMKTIDCYLCGSDDAATLVEQTFRDEYLSLIDESYNARVRAIKVCKACGFVYRSPQLEEADVQVLYERFRDESIRNETPDEYFARITSLPLDQSETHMKMQWFDANAGEFCRARAGKVLDIGCGGGIFLHRFLQWYPHWQGHGVEPTRSFAALAARKLNIPVKADMYRPGIFAEKFDLICIQHVLEHVLDPIAFMRGVATDLAPTGRIYLEGPDVADFPHLPPDHDRFHAQHVHIFSLPVLAYVFRRAGLSIERTVIETSVRGKRDLRVLASLAPEGATARREADFPLQDYRPLLAATERWRKAATVQA